MEQVLTMIITTTICGTNISHDHVAVTGSLLRQQLIDNIISLFKQLDVKDHSNDRVLISFSCTYKHQVLK